jgi:hypothetical protein
MSVDERRALVEAARRQRRWPSRRWLEEHAAKRHPRRTPEQFAEWAQMIKNRPRTQVYAYIAVSDTGSADGREGFAFIDPKEGSMVWFDVEASQNLTVVVHDEPVAEFLSEKQAWYWRLADCEVR